VPRKIITTTSGPKSQRATEIQNAEVEERRIVNQIRLKKKMFPVCNVSPLSLQPGMVIPIPGKPTGQSSFLSVTNSASSGERISTRPSTISPFESRISLVFALASQANSLTQRRKCFSLSNFVISLLLFHS